MEFSSKGFLENISGTIGGKDAKGKFSATDFEKVIIAMVKDRGKTFFNVIIKSRTVI